MRKWLFCTLILAVIPILSYGGMGGEDIGKLRPVHVVMIRSRGDEMQIMTDTADLGTGTDASKAVINMQKTSTSKVFLDTADYLLLEPGAEKWLPKLQSYLRPSCNLCYVIGDVDLEQAGQFLQIHEPELALNQYEAGERQIPYLISEEGRMKLVRS